MNDKIEALKKDLEAPATESPGALHVEKIDTSSWKEFGTFFQAPASKFLNYQWNSYAHPCSPEGIRRCSPCAFVSVVSASKEKAIEALRGDLLKLRNAPQVEVRAFLAFPSTIELARPMTDGDIVAKGMGFDLRSGTPAKRIWAAFCFVHGGAVVDRYTDDLNTVAFRHLDQTFLRELGLEYTAREGEIGKFVD